MRAAALVCFIVLIAAPGTARATGALGSLSEAQARLNAGEYVEARDLAGPLLDDESLARADRAEAYRLYGLALFFLGNREEADAALFEFLKLEPEAHLDAALVPSEGIAFFEDVRSRHARELAPYRKRLRGKNYVIANLIPPLGQFQNGDHAKGWALLVSEGLLLSTYVTSWALLYKWCHDDNTCEPEGAARTMRTVNLVSGALFAGVYVYGIVDGYVGWKRRKVEYETGPVVGVSAGSGGASVTVYGTF